MHTKMKWGFGVAGLVLLLLLALVLYRHFADSTAAQQAAQSTSDAVASQTDDTAPVFSVTDANGSAVSLSDFRGKKPVVVNFWASWCPPCKAEMPEYEQMYRKYGDQVAFMMVNLTDGDRETVGTAKKFIAAKGYTFPVYFDEDLSAAMLYGVSSIPQSVFIGKDGSLVRQHTGQIEAAALEQDLRALLNAAGS